MAGIRTAVVTVVLAALLAVALATTAPAPALAQLPGIICTTKCGAELLVCLAQCPQQQQQQDSIAGTLCNAGCIVKYNLCTAPCSKK